MTRSRTAGIAPAPLAPALAPASKPVTSPVRKSKKSPVPVSAPASSSREPKPKPFKPILRCPSLLTNWDTDIKRDLIVEQLIDIDHYVWKCNVISLLRDQNLLHTLQNVRSYSDWLTPEIYVNLTSDTALDSSPLFHKIFVRNTWYDFSPSIINAYLHRSEIEEPFEPALDFLASALTHAQLTVWPQGDIQSNLLTTVYSVFFRFASHNWLPNASRHVVTPKMANLLYKIRNKMDVDLETVIFDHVMSFTPSKESKTDARLYSGTHYDDRASLLATPIPDLVPPQDAPSGSSTAPAASDPVSPSELVQLKSQAAFYQSTLDNLKSAVSTLRDVISATEPKLVATLCQINALEEQLASQDPDVEGPSQDDEGTPSGSPVL
ncbi:uncharacterized protein LOC116022440 [Ipomoea triloba]|uniref:uncharacterized protein LOC116022440 n=1 Tax=Ipomoea triloba TaxID=35885 RepID=UPI00125DFA6E|nr:uncharacterized protein LOC116022440 [Ipomoea triloba]